MTLIKRCLILSCLSAWTAACTTYQYADNVKLVGIKAASKRQTHKIARLNDQICDLTLFGAPPVLQESMNAATADHKVSYFRDVTTDYRIQPAAIFLVKQCLVFMGDAYK